MSWRWWWTPLLFLALAVAWTWPAAWPGGVPGRWPDALGTVWFIDASPRLLHGLDDPLTGWPAGAHYGRPDSFVLLALSAALPFLPPLAVYGAVSVLGVALSAWAAERLAAELGAAPPWSLLAGLGYACCGLASTALIEGYPYHVLDPWMPLMAAAWLRALAPGGRLRDGLLTGLFFTLTLLSSAWLSLSAAVLLAVVGVVVGLAQWRQVRPVAALSGVLAVAVPLGLYAWRFAAAGAGGEVAADAASTLGQQLRLSLVQLAGPGLGVDERWHSQSNAVGAAVLGLAAVAPVVLGRGLRWKALLAAGGVSLLLSVSPRIDPGALAGAGPELLEGLGRLLAASLLRFPMRLGWAWALCAGAVGACAATVLARRAPRRMAVVGLIALADAFLLMRQPFRQAEIVGEAPSAYAAHSGPVLDVFPEDSRDDPGWKLWTTNLACYYQTVHGRPIADHCLFVDEPMSPRLRLQRFVVDRALSGEGATVAARLGELGFGSVVVHLDHFAAGDREALLAGLAAVDPAPVISRDGGEYVAAFALEPAAGDPTAAWQVFLRR